jgi:uncharacterized protein
MHTSFTTEQIQAYRATVKDREIQRQQQQLERQHQGWAVARQAAQILKDEFGAQRVWLFGSMLETRRVHAASDIDLAVAGLSDRCYLQAVSRLLNLSAFSVDLVEIERAKSIIRSTVEEQGVEL